MGSLDSVRLTPTHCTVSIDSISWANRENTDCENVLDARGFGHFCSTNGNFKSTGWCHNKQ